MELLSIASLPEGEAVARAEGFGGQVPTARDIETADVDASVAAVIEVYVEVLQMMFLRFL